ncbi:hypothetical protein EON66_03370, partial [archaeon]
MPSVRLVVWLQAPSLVVRWMESVGAWVCLLMFGIWRIPVVHTLKQQVRCKPSKSHPSSEVKSGDILIANQCGYLNVLVLAVLYRPTFTRSSLRGGLQVLTLWQALWQSVRAVPDL